MRILFVSCQPLPPQFVGGLGISIMDLSRSLVKQGNVVGIMAKLLPAGTIWIKNRVLAHAKRKPFPKALVDGIQVYLGWDVVGGLDEVTAEFLPDVVFYCGSGTHTLALACSRAGDRLPSFFCVHDIGNLDSWRFLPGFPKVNWIFNSDFTAQKCSKVLGIVGQVIPPCIDPKNYVTTTSRLEITFINPRPEKGGEVAVQLAGRLPDIPFAFVSAWNATDSAVIGLRERARGLKNVRWLMARSDIRAVYSRSRLIIVPSLVEETWGRVVTEGHFSGIPSVVREIGALPETLGPGGVAVLKDSDVEVWAETVDRVWRDRKLYATLSEQSLVYSGRAEIRPEQLALSMVALAVQAL